MTWGAGSISVLAAILAMTPILYAQSDLRAQEIKMAKSTCEQHADSGSMDDAIKRLKRIPTQDPELEALEESCTAALNAQKNQEESKFQEGVRAFNRGDCTEAKALFQALTGRTIRKVDAGNYLFRITNSQCGGASPGTNDRSQFNRAQELFQENRLDDAEAICKTLVARGGPVAPEAQALLDRIEARFSCEKDKGSALELIEQHQGTVAMDILLHIQQRDPRCPGLGGLIDQAKRAGGSLAPPSPTENQPPVTPLPNPTPTPVITGRENLSDKSPEKLKDTPVDRPMPQARVDGLVADATRLLRRKDCEQAQVQLKLAQQLAPNDERIPALLRQALDACRSADGPSAQEALLVDGIRSFYKGDLAQADQLLEQYLGKPGKYAALAYFYRGAIMSTDYFLSGAKDQQKEAQAREFFAKGRRANAKFVPPREWISPKIIEIYQKAAGS